MNWLRLGRTLRPLKASQIAWRVLYLVRRRVETTPLGRVGPGTRRAAGEPPAVRPGLPSVPLLHPHPGDAAGLAAELAQGCLTLLNRQLPFRGGPDWRMLGGRSEDRLWVYTLHYHGWLLALAEAVAAGGDAGIADVLADHLADWLDVCAAGAPGFTHYAWNSYAIATRLSNWCRMFQRLPAAFWADRPGLADCFLRSLALQAAYLDCHLEWDLRGNHLIRDALGLAWAGRFLSGPAARRWLDRATALAVDQVAEQVLADGGHFERSPMYHAHVMEDLLALALLLEDEAAGRALRDAWRRMSDYLAWARHPDGGVPLFNDAGLGSAPEPDALLRAGATLGVAADPAPRRGGRRFPETGLVVWHGGPWSLFFDVGPVGPDYQPGHAHADTLALECSYRGRRLFVDPGTYGYDRDDRRHYDRSTDAHNTVSVDGRDSSEVWHIFRVGRRAYPLGVRVESRGDGLTASASHDGYDHLPGRPRPTRRVEVREGGPLTVSDRVDGRGRHDVRGGLLLDPGWTADAAPGGWLLTSGPDRVRLGVRGPEGLALSEESRPYHPDYHRELTTTRLCWRLDGPLPAEVVTVAEEA
jgi:uncharacterized heparinase superfamily protein